MGQGEGRGDGEEGIIAGSAVSVGLTVFMCVCGIPMILTGIVLLVIYNAAENSDEDVDVGWMLVTGILLIVISGLLLVGGIILIILLCTGVLSNNKTQPAQGGVILHQQPGQPMGVYPQPVPQPVPGGVYSEPFPQQPPSYYQQGYATSSTGGNSYPQDQKPGPPPPADGSDYPAPPPPAYPGTITN